MTRFLFVALLTATVLASPALAQSQSPLVDWLPFQEALDTGKNSNKKILVDIFAPWCGWCTKMQNGAYTEPEIVEYLKTHFVSTRLDISIQSDTLHYNEYSLPSAHLAAGFGAEGTPTTVFLTSEGEYITRLPGFAQADEFLLVLQFIASDSYKSQSFDEFSERNK